MKSDPAKIDTYFLCRQLVTPVDREVTYEHGLIVAGTPLPSMQAALPTSTHWCYE